MSKQVQNVNLFSVHSTSILQFPKTVVEKLKYEFFMKYFDIVDITGCRQDVLDVYVINPIGIEPNNYNPMFPKRTPSLKPIGLKAGLLRSV